MTVARESPAAPAHRGLLWVAVLSVAASIVRTLLGGQDLNFDLVTYHYYLGYSAFVDRFALDFLAAGPQGYQSPLPYALLYGLDRLGAPPALTAAFQASIHALNLIALYLLVKLLVAETEAERNRAVPVSFWLLGAIAPVYWKLVGTSFADLTASVPVLWGLWLAAESLPAPGSSRGLRPGKLALGAALAGLAVGLRAHTAIYAIALAVALVFAHFPRPGEKSRALIVFFVAAAGAWIASFGPWAWHVYRDFGNPLFPLYNGIFHSPDFPNANLPLTSFVPATLGDVVTLPFRIGTYTDWIYIEGGLPDVRPALLVVGVLACGGVWLYRRVVSAFARQATTTPPRRLIMAFFLVGAISWLATSCNGRYGVALFLLAGPVCGVLLHRILPTRYLLFAAGAVVLWQAALLHVFFKQSRWASGPWTSREFDWDLPAQLARQPAVYLSFGYQTASALAPRVHPASRHVNLVGQYTPAPEGPGRQKIREIIATPGRPIYGVFDFYFTQQADPAARSIKTYFRKHLRLWGLDFTPEPCTLIPLKVASPQWDWLNSLTGAAYRGRPPEFILCELRRSLPGDEDEAVREFRGFRTRLEPLVDSCAQIFRRPLTFVRVEDQWWVTSFASFERRVDFDDDGRFYLQQLRPPYAALALGEVTPRGIVSRDPDCGRWLARLRELSARATQ